MLPILVLAALPLAGCETSLERMYSSRLPFDTPIDWWHQLQGGVIATERPPPPGVGDPYPAVGSIPPKPVPTDAATRSALSARLVAQRTQMQRDAEQDPLKPLPPAAPPATAGAVPPPATTAATPAAAAPVPEAPPPMARIEAATAPAPPPPAVVPAAPPAPAAIQQAAAARPARPMPTPDTQPVVSGPVPALPTAMPPLPSLPGIPAATVAPATPRPRPQALIAFLPNSAVLQPDSDAALRDLAARRAGGPVAVLGGGDASSAAPDAQAAALPLAWRRARAIEAVLAGAGVPASAMRVDAAALGRGGIARLVN